MSFRDGKRFVLCVALCVALAFPAKECLAAGVYLLNGVYYWHSSGGQPPVKLSPERARESIERVNDPAHLVFTGLGPDGNQSLTVDRDVRDRLFAVLGRAKRLHEPGVEVPIYGYVSSRPGDHTVLTARLDDMPGAPWRIYELDVFADPRMIPEAKGLQPCAGVNAAVATKSGLRLGLTKDEVKAILGWPHAEDENTLSYGTYETLFLTLEEARARGYDAEAARRAAGRGREIRFNFAQGRVVSFYVLHSVNIE
ncbi:hypothetical protein [Desulfovibrio aminophilus]|uniref:hypothetical protein n=1 Tax=Desulfovibrio aminophilus TaxID=81425 RepID=UPI0012EBB8B4|nr:hypothetical protein [Desulfovibrio aminophilus]